MRVIVTGATGFLGRSLLKRLEAAGDDICLWQRRDPTTDARVHRIDLATAALDRDILATAFRAFAPDVVIHLAWGHATNLHRNDPRHYMENLRFTEHLIDVVADSPRTFFVGIGSQAEYGTANRMLTPATPAHPLNAYGRAKKIAGDYALARLGHRAAWLRLLTAYGPGDDPNKFLPHLVRSFTSGVAPDMSPGDQLWDWLHVEDAVAGIESVARHRAGGLHVLAAGEAATLKDVAFRLRDIARKRGHKALDPNVGARAYNANELMVLTGDASSLRRATGWAPKISLDQGLETLF